MRKFFASLFLLLSLPAWGNTLVVFGDSLSAGYGLAPDQGWVTLLKDRLERKGFHYKVVNASISGDTSAGGAARIEKTLSKYQPDILILELGANDGLRGLSLQMMKRNLGLIIQKARGSGAQVLLLGMQMPPNYGPRYTERFSSIYRELAEEHQLPTPPFLLEQVALDPTMMQTDNLHPNAKGQPKLLDTVWDKLHPLLTNTMPR